MPKPYEFLLFDFVNTLFMPDTAAVPTIEVDGKRVVSTAALLREQLPERFGHLDVRTIHQAHRDAWNWVEAQRGEDHREIEAPVRFRHFLALLGLPDAGDELVETAVGLHMGIVTGAFRLPPEHRDLLDRLRRRYRMGILSNFDFSPPLRALLATHGIAGWFETVVISADIGCRKPSPRAFSAALDAGKVAPPGVLHVGDTWVADVEGARGASIDVAWINLNGAALPQDGRATYVIERLTQLEPLLD
jgi:FMN phosphatase YigB (HAD superfamily)